MKKALILLLALVSVFAIVSCKPECEHEFEVTTPATCVAKGVQTCKFCGATDEIAIDSANHVGFSVTALGTCVDKGVETCACGATRDTSLDPANHGGYTVAIDATCVAKGVEICGCGKDMREIDIDPTNHDGYTVTTAATCIAKGLETCGCGNDTREIDIDPANHNFIDAECNRCHVNEMDFMHPNKVYNKTKSTEYDTFAAAIDAAATGDEIILCKDEAITAQVQIKVGLTLDLNGHTIENTTAGKATIYVRAASGVLEGTVKIKNGTIKGKPTGDGTNSMFSCVDVDKVILEKVTATTNVPSGQTAAATALYFNGVRNAEVINCTVTGKTIAYQRKTNDTSIGLVIDGGTFAKDPNAPNNNILRLCSDSSSITGSITIKNASFNGVVENACAAGYVPTLSIVSGTWTSDVSAYVPETSQISFNSETGIYTITEKE